MYEAYYRLRCNPFSLLPDPAFLFPSRQHAMALTLLRYSLISKHGITVLTGEVGAGKTTLINKLIDDVDDRHALGLINFTDKRISVLWPWILSAFGLPHAGRNVAIMHDRFIELLQAKRSEGRSTVLIVDEAQNLTAGALENLRMLSNVNAKETLLQLILVGQPEFREVLKRPDLRQLNQRISVFYRLDALSVSETRQYISHRIQAAGGRPDTFTEKAQYMIWMESGGIARRINTLCDLALVYGYSSRQPIVGADVVSDMLTDRRDLAVQTEYPADNVDTSNERRLQGASGDSQSQTTPARL
jgi:type II secretory pathway predicted ATPase ExeA